MHSHGRPQALADESVPGDVERGSVWAAKNVVFFALPPATLRMLSLQADHFNDMQQPSAAVFFGPRGQRHGWYPEGEIQTLVDFGPRVDDVRARRASRVGDRKRLSGNKRVDLWWASAARAFAFNLGGIHDPAPGAVA